MQLKREIGFFTALLLSINSMFGADIFFIPAIGAAYAGPASLISWAIMAAISVLMACYFAELVSMFPKAGGIYEFTKNSFGQLPAFIIGWSAWIISNITIALLIVGSLYYLLPDIPFFAHVALSIGFIAVFNFINYIGIRYSAKMLLIFGFITILTLAIIIFPGLFSAKISNLSPFFVFPLSSIFLSLFFVAEAFFGWESITFLAEEIKNPKKILPKALIVATVVIGIISFALVFVCLSVSRWDVFSQAKAPIAYIASILFGAQAGKLFAALMFIPMIGAAACWIVSSPRLLFALARDKLFITDIQKIHPRYRTPHVAIAFQAVITSIITLVCFGSYRILLSLLIPLIIITYCFVLLTFVKLRVDMPGQKRYFRAPFGRVGPLAIILFSCVLLCFWLTQPDAVSMLCFDAALIALGFPAYIIIKLQTDKRFIEKFWDRISFAFNWYFPLLLYGKAELKQVLANAQLNKEHVVLDYGCGTGITTVAVAKQVKKVLAADLSKKQIGRAIIKAKREFELPNIVFVKITKAASFEPRTFDRVICTLTINYFVNPKKELQAIARVLKPGGIISALAILAPTITTHKFLLHDRTIRTVFKTAGFSNTEIKREKKLCREYIYIKAQK